MVSQVTGCCLWLLLSRRMPSPVENRCVAEADSKSPEGHFKSRRGQAGFL